MLRDNLTYALKNIKQRRFRSFLTLLGIAIGIMAIVSLMGIGEGMQSAVTTELSSLSDTVLLSTQSINIQQGGGSFNMGRADSFSDRDISDIRRVQGVRIASPILSGMGFISFNGENASATLLGLNPVDMENIFGIEILGLESGSFINEGQQNLCIVGNSVAHTYFDVDLKVGDHLRINGEKFIIAGIYNKQGAGFSVPADDNIHITDRDFEKLTGQKNIHVVVVRIFDVSEAESIAIELEQVVNENHGVDDFAHATTMSSILDSIKQILTIIQVVLIAIASVALVVASIGIMNTMLTSVMERTREIGIMKAIGATNTDVLLIFLVEGLTISAIGGILGIILGYVGSNVVSLGLTRFLGGTLEPVITLVSILLAVGVSFIVGIISSLYPARKASKMSPIEAVRYE